MLPRQRERRFRSPSDQSRRRLASALRLHAAVGCLAWAALQEVGRENDSKFDRRAQRFCRRDVELLDAAARHPTGNLVCGPNETVEDRSLDAGARMPAIVGHRHSAKYAAVSSRSAVATPIDDGPRARDQRCRFSFYVLALLITGKNRIDKLRPFHDSDFGRDQMWGTRGSTL